MKFSNGHWLLKERCECFDAKQAYDVIIEPGKVTILVPTTWIRHRGDTLGGINLTVVITSPLPEVLRIQTWHHIGTRQKAPQFELHTSNISPLTAKETEDKILISSGTLTLEITKQPWSMTYKRNGEIITKSAEKDLALIKTDWRGHYYDTSDAEDGTNA